MILWEIKKIIRSKFFIVSLLLIIALYVFDSRFPNDVKIISEIDEKRLLHVMTNRRFAYVLKRLIVEQEDPKIVAEELNVTMANLYNIKKRAIASLTTILLNENQSNGNK